MPAFRTIALFTGPAIAALLLLFVQLDPARPAVTAAAAVAIWMAIWWIAEAVPLAVTALLPLVLFPLLGVMDGGKTADAYINHIIFLFIGGFLMAIAMQRCGLHRRIALRILMLFGHSPATVLLGFMLTTGFLSMWISNTATAMMMVPVALAIILNFDEQLDAAQARKLAIGFLLAIAYSASIGGIATLIGSPPNLAFVRILAINFPAAPEVSFAQWMLFALPISLLMFAAAFALLYMLFVRPLRQLAFDRRLFSEQYRALGAASRDEKWVFAAFVSMAALWMFRIDITMGPLNIPGWSDLFRHPGFFNDGTVAIFIVLLLFILPSHKKGHTLLDNSAFTELPWHIILLFGGGFALAGGFVDSGLSAYLSQTLQGTEQLPPLLVIASICLMVTFLTELSSNTATTQMFLPVLAAMAVQAGIHPLLLMLPATLSASFAFMLPVATPPNAIIFGTNRVAVMDMAKTGIWLNLLGVLILSLACYLWAPLVFGFVADQLPGWAGG